MEFEILLECVVEDVGRGDGEGGDAVEWLWNVGVSIDGWFY